MLFRSFWKLLGIYHFFWYSSSPSSSTIFFNPPWHDDMERLIKKIKIGPLVLELCGLEYCAWYPSPSSSGTILYWPLILYEHHSLLSQFSETQLTHIPTATLSSLTFSIFLSLFQSPSQLSLTFSISVSNSPTRSQSPFQSRARSHSPSPSRSRSCSIARSPSRFVAHTLDLPLALHL